VPLLWSKPGRIIDDQSEIRRKILDAIGGRGDRSDIDVDLERSEGSLDERRTSRSDGLVADVGDHRDHLASDLRNHRGRVVGRDCVDARKARALGSCFRRRKDDRHVGVRRRAHGSAPELVALSVLYDNVATDRAVRRTASDSDSDPGPFLVGAQHAAIGSVD
jgi:hypothetical protein